MTGGDDKTESRLRVLLEEDWPAGTMMSFCLAASPNIKPFTYAVEALHSPDNAPILRHAAKDRLAFLEAGTNRALPQTATFVRDFQLIVTVKVPIDGARQPNDQDMECVGALQRRADQCLRDVGFAPLHLDPQTLCHRPRTVPQSRRPCAVASARIGLDRRPAADCRAAVR